MSILVTGGAGYIGSHVLRLLRDRGDDVVVIDDLSTGRLERIGDVPCVTINLAADDSPDLIAQVIAAYGVTAVIHLAAKKQVGESVERPGFYYRENVGGLANLFLGIEGTPVDRFVFSSSAAVYGSPASSTVREMDATQPVNPYGETKLAGEWLVRAAAHSLGIKTVSLRYFNVAGAGWPDLGDSKPLNLLTLAIAAIERGDQPVIFGDDFPTQDGTGVRDYVHVSDLAAAHLVALDGLAGGLEHDVFNVGTGTGASVREILAELQRVSGEDREPRITARRAGDPATVVADITRITQELSWRAERGVADMVESAWSAHLHERAGLAGVPVAPERA
ncbi:UDP-glucose 4-epimerase GalE [Cryobacterium tagatosivorans]|uniref:UDP-glucose 4-epimerase n=1 Tax=Cryobacterium tagatosivorans TaxID=1259199 RepID=A0A4R8UG70_9MICO|nr:UDP-glucose 4-epimerase GalE [Cryobacterium tagatosivorans]TFB53944.1 UDP-glucose 4-epimerase GalE [Cryobacterium tagatosivorans]